jgi:hypothetical protein
LFYRYGQLPVNFTGVKGLFNAQQFIAYNSSLELNLASVHTGRKFVCMPNDFMFPAFQVIMEQRCATHPGCIINIDAD